MQSPLKNKIHFPPFELSEMEYFLIDVIREFRATCPEFKIAFCGGWVRDKLLNKKSDDIDAIASLKPLDNFFRELESRAILNGIKFIQKNSIPIPDGACKGQTLWQVTLQNLELDIREWYPEGLYEEDVLTRDFTCNSIYFDPVAEVIPFGQDFARDLEMGQLKAVLPGQIVFEMDPGRYFRMARFCASKGMEVSAELSTSLTYKSPVFSPWGKIKREFMKLFSLDYPTYAFRIVEKFQLLRVPDGYNHKPIMYKTIMRLMSNLEAFFETELFAEIKLDLGPKFKKSDVFFNCFLFAHFQAFSEAPSDHSTYCELCKSKNKYVKEMALKDIGTPAKLGAELDALDLAADYESGHPFVVAVLGLFNIEEVRRESPKLSCLTDYSKRGFDAIIHKINDFDSLLWFKNKHPFLDVAQYLLPFTANSNKEEMLKFLKFAEKNTIFEETNSLKNAKSDAIKIVNGRFGPSKKVKLFWDQYLEKEPELSGGKRPANNLTFWKTFWTIFRDFDDKESPASIKKNK